MVCVLMVCLMIRYVSTSQGADCIPFCVHAWWGATLQTSSTLNPGPLSRPTLKPWQVMEVLSHVNKRVKGQTSIKLPLTELVAMATDAASQPMVRSFSLVYAEMAFDRAAPADKLAVVRSGTR